MDREYGGTNMDGKPVSASSIEDHVYEVFPNDLNPHGTCFGGRIMEIADMLAASCAKRHCGKVCTTLQVDSILFRKPVLRGELLTFKASVNRVWNSSMEVGVQVIAHNYQTGETKRVVSAHFTIVALDDDNRPTKVIPVIPETDSQKARFERAERRRQHRLNKN